jgi:hypothetical protein
MKATLEFDLPEEEVEHRQAVGAGAMAAAISETLEQLRAWQKYGHEFTTPDAVMDAVRWKLAEVEPIASGEFP